MLPREVRNPQSGGSRSGSITCPRPSQFGQRPAKDSSSPSPMRLRVISHEAELGDVEHLGAGLVPGQRLAEDPDHLVPVGPDLHVDEVDDDDARRRPAAGAAGRSRWPPRGCSGRRSPRGSTCPTFLPVFTSMTVRASVCSMMSEPPDGQPHLAVEGLVELLVHVELLVERERLERRGRSTRPGRPAPG